MRKIFFDQNGDAVFYLTGAGVLFSVLNMPVGIVQREAGMLVEDKLHPVLGASGQVEAWFDDIFLWNVKGELLAFSKGAKAQQGLVLPKTKKLAFEPEPKPAPFKPLLSRVTAPKRNWVWAQQTLVFGTEEKYT